MVRLEGKWEQREGVMDWVDDKLKSVGKESFEQDYDIYEAHATGRCSRVDAIEALIRRGRSKNDNGAGWRVGAAKAIFDAGLQDEALRRARDRRR